MLMGCDCRLVSEPANDRDSEAKAGFVPQNLEVGRVLAVRALLGNRRSSLVNVYLSAFKPHSRLLCRPLCNAASEDLGSALSRTRAWVS